ncbi:MAG: TerC family protein [Pyrinomonadaceae bacterium]|nr:TerC family protein [Pyrinomonadaceae bacterium]
MEYPLWAWVVFFVTVFIALSVDVGIVNRHSHTPSRRETFVWSAVWISLALAFNGFIYWMVNSHFDNHDLALTKTKEFFTGYLIELSLSVDNLFIFLLIFSYFKVPKKFQHRVLFWGIMGALVMRMIMIFAGAELVERFHWIIYIFGVFLLYTGIKMFSSDDGDFDIEDSTVVSLATRFIPISKEYDGEKFFVIKNGKRMGTLLLLVLIVVEFTDLIFAVDSIPAIFGITTDKFIVYTSNIFAILGLRTFFFLLADLADRFHYLKIALAFILSFIGAKMLLPLAAEGFIRFYGADGGTAFGQFLQRYQNHEFEQTIINISLVVVVGAIALAIILSIIFPPAHAEEETQD